MSWTFQWRAWFSVKCAHTVVQMYIKFQSICIWCSFKQKVQLLKMITLIMVNWKKLYLVSLLYVSLDYKTSHNYVVISNYICSNSQRYIVWVKFIYFSFMPYICDLATTFATKCLHKTFALKLSKHTVLHRLIFEKRERSNRPRTHCKFQDWKPHLNAGVSPINYHFLCSNVVNRYAFDKATCSHK